MDSAAESKARPVNADPPLVRAARKAEPIPAASTSLYAERVRVYPRRVRGAYRRVKWALLGFCLAVYYLLPWLRWDRGPTAPDQAVLIDMPGRRAYFFMVEIWPQEVYLLTGLLVLGAVTLFLVTSLLGRVWCGYACPQTVWTDLFMLVERLIEGDRNTRMKRDQSPISAAKVILKTVKHGAWLAIAAATGGAWVLYFKDAPTVLVELFTGRSSVEVYFFVGLFTATTYVLAGWAREQVCTYMCPWPRFQAAMQDEQTLAVTYRAWRGEPRGKHKQGDSWDGRGDCVDCRGCVHVCPTGIDIRDGQQLECINCGLCIDACDEVMRKVGRPTGLIAFATLAGEAARARGEPWHYRLIRPRTIIYAAVLIVACLAMTAALVFRPITELHVLKDRMPIFVALSDGDIRNGYTVKVLNKSRDGADFNLTVEGLAGATMTFGGATVAGAPTLEIEARPDAVATYYVHVRAPRSSLSGEQNPVTFVMKDEKGETIARTETVFAGPGR
ncbi:cytochrome c oxidase accessory protein CcoG [Rhodospirillaceae bacterium SYSU D60015]|uniref:cytochrome c oxidase accessory protein CcoG n=1 Tax=Desertibaculum subflavum TaxID=2268458 RepID=UPI000E665413